MDFSAFLGPQMQKKDDQPRLRAVDESPEVEVLPLDGQSAGKNEEKVRLEAKDRSELKFRTHEPQLDEWVVPEDVSLEDEWNSETEQTRIHRGFWISMGVIIFLGVGWLVFEITRLNEQEAAVVIDTQSILEREEQAEIDARQTIETIQRVVSDFYKSSSVEEMMKYVRHAERVGPMMKNHYSNKPIHASEVMSVVDMNPLTIGNRGGFWVVITKLSSGVDGKLVVEVYSPTDARVDWETHVCAQPMEWARFVKERPPGYRGDFRVYVERENFYNYEFSDSEKYQAFKVTTLNSDEVIYGYALREGQTFRVLDGLLKQGETQKVPVMLKLYLEDGLQSKSGVLIEDIVAPRWLLVDSAEVKK